MKVVNSLDSTNNEREEYTYEDEEQQDWQEVDRQVQNLSQTNH